MVLEPGDSSVSHCSRSPAKYAVLSFVPSHDLVSFLTVRNNSESRIQLKSNESFARQFKDPIEVIAIELLIFFEVQSFNLLSEINSLNLRVSQARDKILP